MIAASVARVLAVRAGGRPRPVSLSFELTHRCNLACRYCDRHTPQRVEMSREQILRALDQFVALGTRVVCLDGGEPLLHPHVKELVAWLVARGVRVNMNTNGILIARHLTTMRSLSKVKISLDGPRDAHDSMRGKGSFAKAVRGAELARLAGARIEFTCVVGSHNAHLVGATLDFAETVGIAVVFQPVRDSLFAHDPQGVRDHSAHVSSVRAAFRLIEYRKRKGDLVGNGWASLRHFRRFPDDTPLPCAAGWINATLAPSGHLHACGQTTRLAETPNVTTTDVATAFGRLDRRGCAQCWCARVVEENYGWGGRIDRLVSPLD